MKENEQTTKKTSERTFPDAMNDQKFDSRCKIQIQKSKIDRKETTTIWITFGSTEKTLSRGKSPFVPICTE
jgi:hypothetical protein